MPNYDGYSSLRGKVTPEQATEYLRVYSASHVPLPIDAPLKSTQEVDRQMEWLFNFGGDGPGPILPPPPPPQ